MDLFLFWSVNLTFGSRSCFSMLLISPVERKWYVMHLLYQYEYGKGVEASTLNTVNFVIDLLVYFFISLLENVLIDIL